MNELVRQDSQKKRRANALTIAIQRWMMNKARKEAARQIKGIKRSGDKWALSGTISKAQDEFEIHGKPGADPELLEIFMRFGVAQAKDSSANITDVRGISKIINPQGLTRALTAKEFRLKVFTVLNKWAVVHAKYVDADTQRMVKESIMRILQEASTESPLPSAGEMARRIRTQFHGRDPSKRMFAWSPERAALIARTEMNMAHGVGAHESYKLLDRMSETTKWKPQKRWLAKQDGRSGRGHDEMHNVTIDVDEKFVLPDGTEMNHPGDPSAPIGHLANCRCAERVVMVKRTSKDMPTQQRGL